MTLPLTLPSPHAHTLPTPLRNTLYSTLLSSGSIRTIESSLSTLLQSTGFQATLRAYITSLFRTGQATTAHEAYTLAMNRIRECMAEDAERAGGGGVNGSGVGVNVNGSGSGGGEDEGEGKADLRLPAEVVVEGSRVVRRELERVVEITLEEK